MLTTAQTATDRLEALAHYATRYEVVLTNGTKSFLLGYTARHSRAGLVDVLIARGPAVAARVGMSDEHFINFKTWKWPGLDVSNGWLVRFSRRTQREAIVAGELPRLSTHCNG
jgi:hypothetical protein